MPVSLPSKQEEEKMQTECHEVSSATIRSSLNLSCLFLINTQTTNRAQDHRSAPARWHPPRSLCVSVFMTSCLCFIATLRSETMRDSKRQNAKAFKSVYLKAQTAIFMINCISWSWTSSMANVDWTKCLLLFELYQRQEMTIKSRYHT